MICLRCGHCCKYYFVAIVDNPEYEDVMDEANIAINCGDGTPCQHLKGDKPGEYSCAIHDYPWYKETPCFAHGQIERGNTNCRMGEYVLGMRNDGQRTSKKSTA